MNSMLLLQDLIQKGESQPNLTVGILVAVVVIVLSIFLRLVFGGKKTPVSRNSVDELLALIILYPSFDICFGLYVNHWLMSLVQARVAKPTNAPATETSASQGDDGENEENKEDETSKAPRRRVKRDN